MYFSGVVAAFVLAFIIMFFQGIKRIQNGKDESIGMVVLGGAIFSLLGSIFSWITVLILLVLLLSGKVAHISERNC